MEEVQLYEEVEQDAKYNSQVATAKKYPRNIMKSVQNAITIATMDKETAKTCSYVLPWNSKITGPSVHLAKILVQSYGNLIGESGRYSCDAKEVTSYGICFDTENNTAFKSLVTKSIVDKQGKRFSDRMIVTTGMAAAAIAYRNAVFSVIPKSVVDKVLKEADIMLHGDLSDETKLLKKRVAFLKNFNEVYGVSEGEILKYLEINSTLQIKAAQIKLLTAAAQSLKDNEITVNQMFNRAEPTKKTKMKSQVKKPELLPDTQDWDEALKVLKAGNDTNFLRKKYEISEENEKELIGQILDEEGANNAQ